MKKQLLLIGIFTTFFYNFSYSQITIGSIEKKEEVKKVVEAPPYDGLEIFKPYGRYYHPATPKSDKPTKQDYYDRYTGVKIYYPSYTNDYKKDRVLMLKKSNNTILNWSEVGDKYYTIEKIYPLFKDTNIYNQITTKEKYACSEDILLELKNSDDDEKIYITLDSSPYGFYCPFIIVSHYEYLHQEIANNTFIATTDFSATKIPLREKNFNLYVDRKTEWKGELQILREKDIKFYSNEQNQDIIYAAILKNETDTIVMDFYNSNSSRWYFNEVFTTKSNDKKAQNEKKTEQDKLVNKYGEKFGKLVYEKKLSIGMTKEMCSDVWGITLHRKTYTDNSGKVEVWDYPSIGKLYFKNDKLSDIITY